MRRLRWLVGITLLGLLVTLLPGFASGKGYSQDDPPLTGPDVVRHDTSTRPPLKDRKVVVVKGKEVIDNNGKKQCAFHIKLTRKPGELPQAARTIAFDPKKCAWEVETGGLENAEELQPAPGGESETIPAVPGQRNSSGGSGSLEVSATATNEGAFFAAWYDPLDIRVNEVITHSVWNYDPGRGQIIGHSSDCRWWWLSNTGWWQSSRNCVYDLQYASLRVISNADYKNQAFCNPNLITNVYYRGSTFKAYGNGTKEGYIDATWADGDCASLLSFSSYVQ